MGPGAARCRPSAGPGYRATSMSQKPTRTPALLRAFDIRPGEGPVLALLCLHAFCMGMGFVFFETPANALYLTRFGARTLPLVYLLTALISVATGILYTRLERRLAPGRLFTWTLLLLASAAGVFYFAETVFASRWQALAMMVWKDVLWVLSGLELWAVAGMLLNARQGKRLFGLVATGEVVAVIFGGLAIPLLTTRLDTEHLLLVSFAAELGSVLILGRIMELAPTALQAAPGDAGAAERADTSLRELIRHPYVALFFAVSVLSFLGQYLLDFLFLHQVEVAYLGEAELAGFFGRFFAALGGVNLLANAFVTGPLLTYFGIGAGLLALPLAVAAGTLVALAGRAAPPGMQVVFWAVIGTKLLDEVLRKAMEGPTYRILYQPLPPGLRLPVQAWRESVVSPTAVGLSGLLLLAAGSLELSFAALTGALLVVALTWCLLAIALRHSYTGELTRALERRSLPMEDLTLDDPAFVELLRRGLRSDQPGDVMYSLSLLERLEVGNHEEILAGLLAHPSPEVRAHVLDSVASLGFVGLAEAVARRLDDEADPGLRGRAVRTLGALLADQGVERLMLAMEDPAPEAREGAMVGLLRHGGIDGILAAGRRVQRLAVAAEASERRVAARVLGEVGIASFFRPLLPLLGDPVREVRREALVAAGKLGSPRLTTRLLETLQDPGLGALAAGSLVRLGEAALPTIRQALEETDPESDRARRLLEIAGRIGGEGGRAVLLPYLDDPRPHLRFQCARSLLECGHRLPHVDRLLSLLRREVEDAAWNYAAFLDVNGQPGCGPLADSLVAHARRRREHVVRLLALLYPSRLLTRLVPRMMSSVAGQRAYALEVMDNLVATPVRNLAFPILDDLKPGVRLKRLPCPEPHRLEVGPRLVDLIRGAGARATLWIRAAALQAATTRAEPGLAEAVRGALASAHPLLREGALAALVRLAPEEGREVAARLMADPAPAVRELAASLREGAAA